MGFKHIYNNYPGTTASFHLSGTILNYVKEIESTTHSKYIRKAMLEFMELERALQKTMKDHDAEFRTTTISIKREKEKAINEHVINSSFFKSRSEFGRVALFFKMLQEFKLDEEVPVPAQVKVEKDALDEKELTKEALKKGDKLGFQNGSIVTKKYYSDNFEIF